MTNKFEWKSEYGLDIKMIDEQHQNFFNIANKIGNLTNEANVERDALIAVIGELLNYSLYHLSTEEELFSSLNYPEKDSHIEAHDTFRKRSGQFMGRLTEPETNPRDLAEEVADFAINWLTGHIMVVDKKYAPFFKENGIE